MMKNYEIKKTMLFLRINNKLPFRCIGFNNSVFNQVILENYMNTHVYI